MNATQLKTRSLWLAKQLRIEAAKWSGMTRADLIHAAVQLAYQARIRTPDPQVTEAVIAAGENILVIAMTTRAFPTGADNG
jgi:hypothetical protein